MINAETTLTELSSLLAGIPGINVEDTHIWLGGLSITIIVRKTKWVGPIVYCANAANIPVEIYTAAPSGNPAERVKPKHLRYRIASKIDGARENMPLDRFAMFGSFLVWHLHAVDALATREANRLLKFWNGRRVGSRIRYEKIVNRPVRRKGTSK